MEGSSIEIAQLLTKRFNRWWLGIRPDVPLFKRRDFTYVKKELEGGKVVTLTGPRQVGKTTLVLQLVADLLERGIPAKRILFVMLDDVQLRDMSASPLQDVLKAYESHILGESLDLAREPVYLLLDEVQRVENWAETVKNYYDGNKKLRFVCTGSASFTISQKSSETLPGRQLSFTMFPLKFADAAILAHPELDIAKVKSWSYILRETLEESWKKNDQTLFFEIASKVLLEAQNTQLPIYFNQHLLKGGYPEIVLTKDPSRIQNLFKGYSNDIILKDLMPWFNIRDFKTAEHLLYLLAARSGSELDFSGFIERIRGSNYPTLKKYSEYFEQLNIISTVPRYAKSHEGSRKNEKVYFNDVGFRNALLGLDNPEPKDYGPIAETVLHDHLQRLAYKFNAATRDNIYYHKTPATEIDFILTRSGVAHPIECKYAKSVSGAQRKLLVDFAKKNKTFAISTTQSDLRNHDNLVELPLWLLCLLA